MVAETTTIRVRARTRDQLNALAKRRGESASDVISRLVDVADEETLLAEAAAGFERLAGAPETLAAYRAESTEVAAGFEASAPEW